MSLFKKIKISKHLNKVILATILLILRIWVVLNTSVASMTSTDLITSLASMTSTASLASKNQKQPALYILSDFPGIRNLSGLNDLYSLNNLGGLNNLFSLISSKKLLSLMFPSTLAPKWTLNVGWIIKNSIFYWFLAHFLLEAVEDRDVTFDQIKGS